MTRKSTATDTIEQTEATEPTEEQDEQQPETDQVETAEEALITPYKAAQIILDELQLEIPPQMVYTYVKNGAFGDEAKTSKRITATAAIEWGKALKERRAAKAAKAQATTKKDLEQPVDAQVTEVE
jgi:hypothetical protein